MKYLCQGCKLPRATERVHPETGLPYCSDCSGALPWSLEDLAMFLLTVPGSPVGPPFKPGDAVECRAAGVAYEGVGVVREVSMDLAHGGTPLYPMFRVELTEKAGPSSPDEAWYAEVSLSPVGREGRAR